LPRVCDQVAQQEARTYFRGANRPTPNNSPLHEKASHDHGADIPIHIATMSTGDTDSHQHRRAHCEDHVKAIYTRCTSGHYFSGEYCPFDGWSGEASFRAHEISGVLSSQKIDITIENAKAAGMTDSELARCIVVDFGSETSTFEAMAISAYVRNDQMIELKNFGLEFT
jgi:hypothetical protein